MTSILIRFTILFFLISGVTVLPLVNNIAKPDEGKVEIPFEIIRNHIVLSTKIQGKALHLILDTGMPGHGAILFDTPRIKELNLKSGNQAQLMGVGGKPIPAQIATGITLQFSGLELRDQTIIIMPLNAERSFIFEEEDGIIGYELFSRYIVEIDYEMMVIRLIDPDKFRYVGSGEELPIVLRNNVPFLTCSAEMVSGEKIPMELAIDIGATHALSLNADPQTNIKVPENSIECRVGRGLSDDINGHIGRITKLQLGDFTLNNVLTSFQSGLRLGPRQLEKEGNLGHDALRRFNVTFDYSNKRIILEPNSHFHDPFEFNMAGIQFTRSEQGKFKIDHLITNSPASETGLKAGDIISEINGRTANQFRVDDVEELLQKEGEDVTFTIFRHSKRMEVRLKLRPLI
ncbi:MAG: aspartyl protease family protein [bacterium]|nr:MAG: aspartyl protease family protein [bacterium]